MNRWSVNIAYRSAVGIVNVPIDIEELNKLAERVERGPHWDTIDSIEIRRIDGDCSLTVESALKL